MTDSGMPHHEFPPTLDGCGIMPIAENRIAIGSDPELIDIPHNSLVPPFAEIGSPSPVPVCDDVLEQTYRRVLARALALAACALLLAALTATSLVHNSALHHSFLGAQLLFRSVFVLQLLFMSFCSRYVEKLGIIPAAVLLFAYASFCALEFSMLLPPAILAVGFLCAALMFAATALWGLTRNNDLALPIVPVIMILAGGGIVVIVNTLLRTPSSAWTLSSLAVVIFACLAGYYSQQIRDFYGEYDDDNAEGWKASVLGALLLLANSVNIYLLVATFLTREDDSDRTGELPR